MDTPVNADVDSQAGAPVTDARRVVRSALLLNALIAALALVARWQVERTGMSRPTGESIYFRLFALLELPHLVVALVFTGATAAMFIAARPRNSARAANLARRLQPPSWTAIGILAFSILIVGVTVTYLVMHRTLLSMDEFSADFQARIFARGEFAPRVPWPWRSLQDAIAPIFVYFQPDTGRWASQYLPVYSAIKAVFVLTHLESWLNPLLSAGSLILLGAIARRIWLMTDFHSS